MNIVIMAGGGGTRLWPLSRDGFPKQFTQVVGKRTLLQSTFDRALSIVRKPDNIVVTTRDAYAEEIHRQLPKLPRQNILVESIRRDSGPSIGMAAAFLAAQGKHDEPMLMLASDPYFRNEPLVRKALKEAGKLLAKEDGITTIFGNKPTYPETGYGYIEVGNTVRRINGVSVYGVKKFHEKPSPEKARRYLSSGRFLWNVGIYGWRVSTLLSLYHQFAPDIAKQLDALEAVFQRKGSAAACARIYRRMPSISVDFAITEHQDPKTIRVFGGNYGWSDIGHWGALQEILGGTTGEELKQGVAAQVNATGNFIYSTANTAIGLAGVHNLIVVTTPDGVLVCDKNNVQDVKKLVELLKEQGHTKFL